ncbi:MAG: hypothetical protein NTY38_14370 [Acidobacteria bacterium]|nr:hypothetical protein [Acidobacteriota bacterium]
MHARLALFAPFLLIPASVLAASSAFESAFLKVRLAPDHSAFTEFALDSLGRNPKKLAVNLVHPPVGAAIGSAPAWKFRFSGRRVQMRPASQAVPFTIRFNNVICHATLLGHMNDDGSVRLPALLHLPDYGTIRITAKGGGNVALGYDADRGRGKDFVKVVFPAGFEYDWEIVTLYPGPPALAKDARFDAYRRGFFTILQLNPRVRSLANHSASDPAALTFFQYSMVARYTPPLAEGLKAMDLVRFTLDRHLAGYRSYGMSNYNEGGDRGKVSYPWDSLDTHPSLVSTAVDYVEATGDRAWLEKNYAGVRAWAERMVAFDTDHDGLIESPLSGNSGTWKEPWPHRPANWWDTVGYGHKDAYSNALAYRAFQGMSRLAQMAGKEGDAAAYRKCAEALKAAYVKTFYKPEELANRIMDRMLAKMKEVGFTRFDLGLPGNLIPVRREDYVESPLRFGGPTKEDGSDGFQIYENGGATACHVYWTIQALYNLGRRADAEKILFPLLAAFEEGKFQGRGPDGANTYDWKAWDGTPHGYEGLLVDNYLALLAVYTGYLGRR